MGRVISRASAIATFSPQTHRPCGPGSGVSGCGALGSTMPDKHIRGLVHFTPGEPHQRDRRAAQASVLRGLLGPPGSVAEIVGRLSLHADERGAWLSTGTITAVISSPASAARGIAVACALEARVPSPCSAKDRKRLGSHHTFFEQGAGSASGGSSVQRAAAALTSRFDYFDHAQAVDRAPRQEHVARR